jgi:mannitol/fructose-specific phosphotransferase system IIA component (Ntr-type)
LHIVKISQYLPLEAIIPCVPVDTKLAALQELTSAMVELGYLAEDTGAVKDILAREAKMTTGIGHGIAVPHARTQAADRLRVVFARHLHGLDWGAVDGKPVHFIVLLVSPPDQPGPHLQFLAAVARLLQDEGIQSRLLDVKTAKGLLDTLCPPHRRMTR